ncbi:MAG: vitamin K epoxide reductase family protein [Anaerolineae bacterium]
MKYLNPILIGLAVLGTAVSAYLLTVHWGWWNAVCLGVGDCEVVNTSRWSELLGIPVALLGGLTYLSLLAFGFAILRDLYGDYARYARFLVAAIGVAFSGYLTYIELYVIHEICPWCVLSAIIITLTLILSIIEYRQPLAAEPATE